MERAPETLGGLTLAAFSERLASAEPVPGGGSASAIAGSFAASLLAMVAQLSLGRPKYDAFQGTNERALQIGETARIRLLELADDDALAYAGFSTARKMPRDTPEQQAARDSATRAAARTASEVPLEVVRDCARLIEAVAATAGRSNLNASSDVEVAGRLAAAAARGAAANVLINLPMVGDEAYAAAATAEIADLLTRVDQTLDRISETVATGTLREPELA